MKAFWCWKRSNGNRDQYFEDVIKAAQGGTDGGEGERVCAPEAGAFEAYGEMLDRFSRCEELVCAS